MRITSFISLIIILLIEPILCRRYTEKLYPDIKCYQCDSLENLGCVNLTDPAIESKACNYGSLLTDFQETWKSYFEKHIWGCQRIITSYKRVIRRCSLSEDAKNLCQASDFPISSLRTGELIDSCYSECQPRQTWLPWLFWISFGGICTLCLGALILIKMQERKSEFNVQPPRWT